MVKRMSLEDEIKEQRFIANKKLTNFLLILCIILVAYITYNIIQKSNEQKRVDLLLNQIQNELYLKQCNLNKMYCCNYKDQNACDKWVENNCVESDGSLQINCKNTLTKI